MKTNLVLKNIEVAGVKIGEVSVTQEYSASEAINLMMGGKEFIKSFIKDIPEMATDLKKAYDTVQAIENEEGVVDVADTTVIDKYIDMIKICNSKSELDQVLMKAIRDENTDLDDIVKIKDESKRIIEEKADSITYKYCIQAIKNATCENEINEIVDHARMMLSSADYATITYTAIQRKQEIGVWQPFM